MHSPPLAEGRPEAEWELLLRALVQSGYDAVISVEHEDPIWGGTTEKVLRGLEIGHGNLRPLVVR